MIAASARPGPGAFAGRRECRRQPTQHSEQRADHQLDCRDCRYRFSVISGTLFHDSNVPLEKWFRAIGLIVDHTASVDLRWLAAGTILYFIAQAVRTRGWYTILRTAYPEATDLRAGHVARAYLAGAGVNSIVPARGGDAIKLAMVHRRIDGSRYPTLAATFVPDALCEAGRFGRHGIPGCP